jgi:hypothetical protein
MFLALHGIGLSALSTTGYNSVHGEGGTARTKAKNDMQSTVQGHIHTSAYVDWMVGNSFKIFGMQVGCRS